MESAHDLLVVKDCIAYGCTKDADGPDGKCREHRGLAARRVATLFPVRSTVPVRPPSFTQPELLSAAVRYREMHGRWPSSQHWNLDRARRGPWPGYWDVRRFYTSWREFIEDAKEWA